MGHLGPDICWQTADMAAGREEEERKREIEREREREVGGGGLPRCNPILCPEVIARELCGNGRPASSADSRSDDVIITYNIS